MKINDIEEKIYKQSYLEIIDNEKRIKIELGKEGLIDLHFIKDLTKKKVTIIFRNGKHLIRIDSVLTHRLQYDMVFGILQKDYVSSALLKRLELQRAEIKEIVYLALKPRRKYKGTVKYSVVYQ